MLVLTRLNGQRIIIGDREVIVEVLRCWQGGCKIGIHAAKEIPVHREEILERIEAGIERNNSELPDSVEEKNGNS